MSIIIQRYTESNKKSWDKFVLLSSNGTIFHLRSFLSYHIDRKFDDHSLIIKKNETIIAVFPAALITNNKKKILYSHPGASFGGIVYKNISYQDAKEVIKIITNYCIENSFNEIFLIPAPSIYSKKTDDTFEYLFHRHKYNIKEYYISSYIDIKNKMLSIEHLNKRKKRYIQNYLENDELQIKCDNNFQEYFPILIENKKRHGIKPTHSLNELIKLEKLLPNKLHLLSLYYNDKMIGGALNIIANNNCGVVFYNMINYDYKDFQPASIQIFESINWAIKQKLEFLDLGVSQKPKGTEPLTPHESLICFKEQLGSQIVIRKAFNQTFI